MQALRYFIFNQGLLLVVARWQGLMGRGVYRHAFEKQGPVPCDWASVKWHQPLDQ